MITFILAILFILSLISLSLVVIGEIIALDYPNTKFTKWWRKNIIYNEPNK